MNGLISKINSAIKYSFYAIFFFVPLAMWPDTFELFEFNKMWVVFIFTTIIFFLWGAKAVIEGKITIRRTPLDIPLALFLLAHIISTIFSIDTHTSIWGYYSRFNGGLLSMISYIFLYYAFASNLIRQPADGDENARPASYKALFVAFLSGVAVTLWGIPSHFGYDLTCFVFRGELNVACWTDQFHPTLRIFSTLGQPNWMGTFIAALIPITAGFGLATTTEHKVKFIAVGYLAAAVVFYIATLWTRSQSSFLGLIFGMALFVVIYILSKTNIGALPKKILSENPLRLITALVVAFFLLTFLIGTPIETINKYVSLEGLSRPAPSPEQTTAQGAETVDSFTANPTIQIGGSKSSDIRLIVWQGAIELFKRNPLFGTGVETYAYAYYSVKPIAHNLTSEWDYLYNKAHNEYLNYLATTGAFGLISYLLIILFFFFYAARSIIRTKSNEHRPISLGLLAGFIIIIVSNFFGFSVVILNLFFFLFPLFFFELEKIKLSKTFSFPAQNIEVSDKLGTGRMILIVIIAIIALLAELHLVNYWFADRSYALGYNLNRVGEYVQANSHLTKAVQKLPGEDLYKDELSVNLATLAILFAQENQATQAAEFARQAINLSNEVTQKHPNNVVYLKTRIRVVYALAQLEPSFLDLAIQTAGEARRLAPTDAKLSYNLALFYNQKGDFENTLRYMNEAIDLKPNYIDAYYALALLYAQLAESEPDKAEEYKNLARQKLEYILTNIDPNHEASKNPFRNTVISTLEQNLKLNYN